MNTQKKAFIDFEGDDWFKRNHRFIQSYEAGQDEVIKILEKCQSYFESVLEIGCSSGYRLDAIKKRFKSTDVYGVEPSFDACEYGKKKYSEIHFFNTTADDLSKIENNSLDLVVVGFVFYVVDRSLLLKVVAEIDRVLKDGGKLVIKDFSGDVAKRNVYCHINDFDAYSFKQNYHELFTASKMYELLAKNSFSHSTMEVDYNSSTEELVSISLLRKNQNGIYR